MPSFRRFGLIAAALLVAILASIALIVVSFYLAFYPLLHIPVAIAFLLGIILTITLGWLIRLVSQRRYARAAKVSLFLLTTLVGSWFANDVGYRTKTVHRYNHWALELLSAPIFFESPIFACDSSRGFNGDGYSFAVFDLPPDLEARFREPDAEYLDQNPQVPAAWGSRYRPVTWTATPIPASFAPHLRLALPGNPRCFYCYPGCSTLTDHLNQVSLLASGFGSYFSFIHRTYDQRGPSDIHLFLIDLENKKIYFANHDT